MSKKRTVLFSLILPTIRRTKELGVFLDSIKSQKLKNFILDQVEVIIVDQNQDGRLTGLLKRHGGSLKVKHLKISAKGLSNARNAGLALVQGRYVAFPDDDCFYALDTLEKAYRFFEETGGKVGLFIRALDPLTKEDLLDYPKTEKIIRSPRDGNVFLGSSIGQFYPTDAIRAAGNFDERFGIGGTWGSGEETDYSIRVLEKGFAIHFRPDILVFHEKVNPLALRSMPKEKIFSYALGFGALCGKHGFMGLLFLKILKQLAGVVVFALRLDLYRSGICWITAMGRLRGFLEYKKMRP